MFMKKCPYCKEFIKREAVRCKHCHSNLGGNGNAPDQQKDDEGIKYLQNGFAKIEAECSAIEEKLRLRTGFVFVKHLYSGEELCYALSRVESFLEKMGDELEAADNVSQQARFLFSKNAEETYQRLGSLHLLIEQREPTWWEKARVILKRIFQKLLSLFPLEKMAGQAMEGLLAAA